jgi:hypothetical protein
VVLDVLLRRRHLLLGGARQRLLPRRGGHPRGATGAAVYVDATEDELFRLTTKEGKFTVEREKVKIEMQHFSPVVQFEQDPVQILDTLLPLYLNSQLLRALQESLASELTARMSAMSSATDNAIKLHKNLSRRSILLLGRSR